MGKEGREQEGWKDSGLKVERLVKKGVRGRQG